MILVDTSIWIDHFRTGVDELNPLVALGQVASHPFVIGELAVGSLSERDDTIAMLRALPGATLASDDEFLFLIASRDLAGSGLGFVDVHILASCRLSPGTLLWTRDKRLSTHAADMGVSCISG